MTLCQGCGLSDISLIVSLGKMPPVNAFLTPGQGAEEQAFPLDLYFCAHCTLVQLWPTVDPKALFTDYNHLSSASTTTVTHLADLALSLASRLHLTATSKILEIGCNDGTLLSRFKAVTPHLVGVDPARNVSDKAKAVGVSTWVDFFSSGLADEIKSKEGAFDLVLAINVVAHTPNFVDLLSGVRKLLKPDGTFVMECAHVVPTVLCGEIDTIYHEHVYCFSLHALRHACERVGLTIVDVQKTSMQGGSLRLFLQPVSGGSKAALDQPGLVAVAALLAEEEAAGVTQLATYASVASRAAQLRDNLRARLRALRETCDVVVGLGAPARGVVLMNYCELSTDDLQFVIDDTPLKQGKLVPGRGIPVYDWTKITKDQDVGCLLLSWNCRAEILAKLQKRTSNARVLIPLPTMEEITLK